MKREYILILGMLAVISCNKPYILTDPATGLPPQTLSTNFNSICELVAIKQINGSALYNRLNFQRDTLLNTSKMIYFDSVSNKIDQVVSFTYNKDTVIINKDERMILDGVTKNVIKYYLRSYYLDNSYDDILYEYKYDSYNHLTRKNIYYNGSLKPDYISNYVYYQDNLVSCEMLLKDGITKILQSDIKYNTTTLIKPWIYLYGDSFENYSYLQGFRFGKKSTNPVSNISTKVFDVLNGNLLDSWNTSYGGYVYSNDNYVLQVTCTGDVQQGLGLFIGTMRFDYQCK